MKTMMIIFLSIFTITCLYVLYPSQKKLKPASAPIESVDYSIGEQKAYWNGFADGQAFRDKVKK